MLGAGGQAQAGPDGRCGGALVAVGVPGPSFGARTGAASPHGVFWGGSAGALYSIALAIVGDTFKGRELVSANAAFGIIYASGSLIGPMLNGAALDTYNTHGLMLSSAGIFSVLILGIGLAHYFASRRTVT